MSMEDVCKMLCLAAFLSKKRIFSLPVNASEDITASVSVAHQPQRLQYVQCQADGTLT